VLGVLGLAAAVFPGTLAARADTPPSVWERARDPGAAAAHDLHVAVQRWLSRPISESIGERDLLEVLARLERFARDHPADFAKSATLRFDLAFVHSAFKNYPRAAELYRAGIADFPNHPATEEAWFRLALACGHIGDHECERDAYTHVLRIQTEDARRVTATLNLAETYMHLGDLKEAIAGYRETLRLTGRLPSRETAVLATWGLAIALDRSGDRAGAEQNARFALELERSMGVQGLLRDRNTVFFEPEYEIFWYEGLGAIALARGATSAREALKHWLFAERSFEEFVRAAARRNDRWLPIARARLAQVSAERERAERAAGREPPPPGPDQDVRL
jgi:tetratricopeptide (TPR) repeat protein